MIEPHSRHISHGLNLTIFATFFILKSPNPYSLTYYRGDINVNISQYMGIHECELCMKASHISFTHMTQAIDNQLSVSSVRMGRQIESC